MTASQRASDPEGSDFSGFRVPQHWRAILISMAGIGSLVGSFWVTTKDRVDSGSRPKLDAMQLERLTRIENKVDEAVEAVAGLANENSDIRTQVSEMRRSITRMEREYSKRTDGRADEMHNEIMEMLREFQAKGVKRR